MKVKIKLLHPDAKLPEKQHILDAGFDLFAVESVSLYRHGDRALVDCGFAIELPPGYEAQIRPRSGLANKNGITVVNSPGTIDATYRGSVKVGLVMISDEWKYVVNPGDRIAQMVIQKLPEIELECVEELSETERGTGAFGSTGL